MEQKADMVEWVTGDRTRKSSELTVAECDRIIKYLENYLKDIETLKHDQDLRADRMRKKIIAIAKHEMGWSMDDIDAFCEKRGYCHQKLMEHTYKELPQLVTQFEEVYSSWLAQQLSEFEAGRIKD